MSFNTVRTLQLFLTLHFALASDEARDLLRGQHIRVLPVEVRICLNEFVSIEILTFSGGVILKIINFLLEKFRCHQHCPS